MEAVANAAISLGAGAAAFLEREAGHNCVSLGVILLGIAIVDPAQRAQFGHDLIVFGLGVLARSMGARS